MSGKSAADIEKEEEERLAKALEKKRPASVMSKQATPAKAAPAATPEKKEEPKTPRKAGEEPEWRRRQREQEEEKERKLQQDAEALQKRLSQVGTSKPTPVDTGASAPPSHSTPPVVAEPARQAGGFSGTTAADRAAEEEARIAKTLQTHFSGSRVEQRMKMQEKQEELLADLNAKGGAPTFDLEKYRHALIEEINDARTQPKIYVKKLMKLKTCFTGKDFLPPVYQQSC